MITCDTKPFVTPGASPTTRCSRTAVVLVHHGDYAQRYFSECYGSLEAQNFDKDRMALFVVDNGASRESRRLIHDIAPAARMMSLDENTGWAGGNNAAIRRALAEGFDYIVLLNMDTVVDRDWLGHLVEEAERNPSVHVLQSKILLNGTGRINSLGNRIQFLGFGYCNGYGKTESSLSVLPAMDFASGAAMLVKREVFETIGFFREDYFMYYEDQEFCWRARLAGFRVGLAQASVCHHKYDFNRTLQSVYCMERNRLRTFFAMCRLPSILLILPCLIASEMALMAYFAFRGWGMIRLKLWGHFLRLSTWKSIARHRRQMRSLRVRKDAGIVRNFAPVIVFAEVGSPAVRYIANPILWLYWTTVRRLIVW